MTIRVGIIGTGVMGADHARILHRDIPHADVVLLADVDTARAALVAAEVGDCDATDDALGLIRNADVDAVLVASSDATHVAYVNACLDAGKPVLCEKPLAPTAVQARRLVDLEAALAGDSSPLISVGFMRRFDPGYVELRHLITNGDLGVPLLVHSTGRGVSASVGSDELTITGSAIHDLDIVPWLLGAPIVEASWHAARRSPGVTDRRDPQIILVRTADGALSTIEVFLNARYGYDIRCEVVGSRSSASLAEPYRTQRDEDLRRAHTYPADWRPRFAEAYRLQNRAWIESLTNGTATPLATAADGLQAARVADAVIASMHRDGAFVRVEGATA